MLNDFKAGEVIHRRMAAPQSAAATRNTALDSIVAAKTCRFVAVAVSGTVKPSGEPEDSLSSDGASAAGTESAQKPARSAESRN